LSSNSTHYLIGSRGSSADGHTEEVPYGIGKRKTYGPTDDDAQHGDTRGAPADPRARGTCGR
jgi:hypothetical protein